MKNNCSHLKMTAENYIHKILSLYASPHQIVSGFAIGIAVGIVIGLFPTLGLGGSFGISLFLAVIIYTIFILFVLWYSVRKEKRERLHE